MSESTTAWYKIDQENQLDSPSLLIYKDRVEGNIDKMIHLAGGVERLFPHIKTNKMSAVVQLLKEKGVQQVKCATLAEAELAASVGIQRILVAHQLVGPKSWESSTLRPTVSRTAAGWPRSRRRWRAWMPTWVAERLGAAVAGHA